MFTFCVNVSSVLNTFHRISLSCKKYVVIFIYFFDSWPESQSTSLPYVGVRPTWQLQMQRISFPGRVEGVKMLPPHGAWVTEAIYKVAPSI